MITRDEIVELATQHITDQHDVLEIEQRDDGQLITVQCYGPLAVEQFCGFGMALGSKYPTARILGPNAFEEYKIRVLI